MEPMFWAWVAIAVILAACEGFTGGLFILPWAIGAVCAAGLNALQISPNWQWAAFITISSVLAVAAQRLIVQKRR